ncbi:YopX family protein [Flavobacteriaceae bacterium GF1]
MRTIKYRGLTRQGEWVYGNYTHLKKDYSTVRKGHYISNKSGAPFAYMVRPESVGQFTGLHDRNGKEIYEGDIVDFGGCVYKVYWAANQCGFHAISNQGDKYGPYQQSLSTNSGFLKKLWANAEIKGNAHQNPEML